MSLNPFTWQGTKWRFPQDYYDTNECNNKYATYYRWLQYIKSLKSPLLFYVQ